MSKEDIESLGWKLTIPSNSPNTNFLPEGVSRYEISCNNIRYLMEVENTKLSIYTYTVGRKDGSVHNITIKNKSELKRLIKQLGINE